MNLIINTVLSILLPIFFGFIIKNLKVFSDGDSLILRKFVIRCTVPFIIFKNLFFADVSEFSQLIPSLFGFVLISLFYFLFVLFITSFLRFSQNKLNSVAFSTMFGNYGYMGWGVVNSFFGEKGLNRSIFFTMFFWPIFLILGFLFIFLKTHKGISKKVFFKTILINASIPIISSILGISANLLKLKLPIVFETFIINFANLTIPLILFTIGLELNFKFDILNNKLIFISVFTRLIFSQIFAIITCFIILKLFKYIDKLTLKVIMIETVMPTATMAPFFSEYTDTDRHLTSVIITISTILSLITIPLWYLLIENFLIKIF
jgi:hypothetical protein